MGDARSGGDFVHQAIDGFHAVTGPVARDGDIAGIGLDIDGRGGGKQIEQRGELVLNVGGDPVDSRGSEEHTSELQSLMRNSYAVLCLNKKQTKCIYVNYSISETLTKDT